MTEPSRAAPSAAAIESIGVRLRRSFATLRVHLCSVHDDRGEALWQSEGFLGPDEHYAVLHAFERFTGRGAPGVVVDDLGDGRCAAVLRSQTTKKVLAGAVLLIVDARNARGDAALASFSARPVEMLLEELAELLAPPAAAADEPGTKGGAFDTGATAIGRRINLPIPATEVDPDVDRLFAALRRTAIALHVQELFPLSGTAGAAQFEVLLRSGADATEAPHKMLARATKAGLASMIDRRVITMLLGWLVRHRTAWAEAPPVFSVNLSATALRDEHFCQFLELCLTKARLPHGMVAFEIDEQACLANTAGLAALSALLDRLGCTLAIDDFSGSRASLELLRVRAVRMVKFGDSLTASLTLDAKRQEFAGLLQMTRVLGLSTTAKRCNDARAREQLAALGVNFLQSFSAAAPCQIDAVLESRRPHELRVM
jgi:EAL domain-containing protein (putative c-di-GMP-specific phosphodiesterase class I)